MSAPSAVGIALTAAAACQAVLALYLDRAPITGDAYSKVVEDGTREHEIDGLKNFFHDEEAGPARVQQIVRIGSLASRVTTQLASLLTALLGVSVLTWISFVDSQALAWQLGSALATLVAIAAVVTLADKIRKGTLRDFRLRGAGPGDALTTPAPYVLVVVGLAIYAAVAGLVFG